MSDNTKLVTENPFSGLDNRPPVPRKQKPVEPPVEEVTPPIEPVEDNKVETSHDLLAGLDDETPTLKSVTVHIDSRVIAELDKLAKKKKKSRSAVLNTILKNYLLD